MLAPNPVFPIMRPGTTFTGNYNFVGDVTITGNLTITEDLNFSSVSANQLHLANDDFISYGNTAASPDFVMGVNSGDSDRLTLSSGGTLGTNNQMEISASGVRIENLGIGVDEGSSRLLVGPDAVDDSAVTAIFGEDFTTDANDSYAGIRISVSRNRSNPDVSSSTRGLIISVAQDATGQNTGILSGATITATTNGTGTTGAEVTGVTTNTLVSSSFNQTLALLQGHTASNQIDGAGGTVTLAKAARGHTLYANGNLTNVTKSVSGSFSSHFHDTSVDATYHIGVEVETPGTTGSPTPTRIDGIFVGNQNLGTTAHGLYLEGATTNTIHVESGNVLLRDSVELILGTDSDWLVDYDGNALIFDGSSAANGGVSVQPATITSADGTQTGFEVAITLNDTGAAGGSDIFSLYSGLITQTDTTGFDETYFLRFLSDGNEVFNISPSGKTAITIGLQDADDEAVEVELTMNADVNNVSVFHGSVTGLAAGHTLGNETTVFKATMTGDNNDTDHEYIAFTANDFTSSGGAGQATAMQVNSGYTYALRMDSGNIAWEETAGTIETLQDSAGAGPSLTFRAASGVTAGAGGGFEFIVGLGAGGSEDGDFLISKTSNGAEGPLLALQLNTSSPADGDVLGNVTFNDGTTEVEYGFVRGEIQVATGGSEDGIVRVGVVEGGTEETEYMRFDATSGTRGIVASKILDATAGGLKTKVATDNVAADPPTDAELDTAFGDPTTVGAGFVGILDDNDAGTDVWIVWTTGTAGEWFYAKGTKAV